MESYLHYVFTRRDCATRSLAPSGDPPLTTIRKLAMSMERHQFGLTKREVAVIGQGTWYDKRDDRKSAIAALRQGLDLGMTHIDTAEMYLSGEAEKWVREAILQRRDEVFLVSKVLPGNASRKGTL